MIVSAPSVPCDKRALAQPQHSLQHLVQRLVGQESVVGLRQRGTVRQPGHQRGVPAGPEPADGQHLGHQNPGASGHQGEIGLVLDLLEAVKNQGGPGIPVEAEPPQFRQHPGVRGVTAVNRQLDRPPGVVVAGEPLHSPAPGAASG